MQPKIPLSLKVTFLALTIISFGLIMTAIFGLTSGVEVKINGTTFGWWHIGMSMLGVVILNAFVVFYDHLQKILEKSKKDIDYESRYNEILGKSKYNTDFYGNSAKILINGLRKKVVEKIALTSSERAKFLGETNALEEILTVKIPAEFGKIHDTIQAYDHQRDYASVHKSAASLSNFYYSATTKLKELQEMSQPKAEDIDNELADIIEAWDVIVEKHM